MPITCQYILSRKEALHHIPFNKVHQILGIESLNVHLCAIIYLSDYPQPQPGPAGGNQMFPPYPAAANSNFPPYPPNNFGSYPPYPPATGSATSAGYPPYMPSGYPQPGAGYNTNYVRFSTCTLTLIFSLNMCVLL